MGIVNKHLINASDRGSFISRSQNWSLIATLSSIRLDSVLMMSLETKKNFINGLLRNVYLFLAIISMASKSIGNF